MSRVAGLMMQRVQLLAILETRGLTWMERAQKVRVVIAAAPDGHLSHINI